MKILSCNVNGLRIRMQYMAKIFQVENPDVICLQETKVSDAKIGPMIQRFETLGYPYTEYSCEESSRHGVLIASKTPMEFIAYKNGRVLIVSIDGIIISCVYINQGRTIFDPEFKVKLKLMKDLYKEWSKLVKYKFIACGDFNTTRTDNDISSNRLVEWKKMGKATIRQEERDIFNTYIEDLGLIDVGESTGGFTWIDQRFRKSRMRLDYFLTNIKVKSYKSLHTKDLPNMSDHDVLILEV